MTLQPMFAANTDRWLWWDWVGRNTDLIRHALWVHIELTVVSVVLALALTGYSSARFTNAIISRAVVRTVGGGVLAMGVTYAVGSLVGANI